MPYSILFYISNGVIPLLYYSFIIVSSITQNDELITNKVYLMIYGIFGLVSIIMLLIFLSLTYTFLAYLVINILIIIGIILLLNYSKQNRHNFGSFILITSILLLVSSWISFYYNIMPFFSIFGIFIYYLIPDILFIIGMLFLIFHGYKNKDYYIFIAGWIQVSGHFIVALADLIRIIEGLIRVSTRDFIIFNIKFIIYITIIVIALIFIILKRMKNMSFGYGKGVQKSYDRRDFRVRMPIEIPHAIETPEETTHSRGYNLNYCPNCGKKIENPNQNFCQYCGAKL